MMGSLAGLMILLVWLYLVVGVGFSILGYVAAVLFAICAAVSLLMDPKLATGEDFSRRALLSTQLDYSLVITFFGTGLCVFSWSDSSARGWVVLDERP